MSQAGEFQFHGGHVDTGWPKAPDVLVRDIVCIDALNTCLHVSDDASMITQVGSLYTVLMLL